MVSAYFTFSFVIVTYGEYDKITIALFFTIFCIFSLFVNKINLFKQRPDDFGKYPDLKN